MDVPPDSSPTHEQVIERRLIECGLNASGIFVQYENEIQSIEIVVRPSAGANPEHFACIHEAAKYKIVTFEDREMHAAYLEYESGLARPAILEDFQTRLRDKGLLEDFPMREDYKSMADYAAALEKHAGVPPGSALRATGNGILFDPPRGENNPQDLADFSERYSDLLTVAFFASVRDLISFGFLGNKAIREEE